MTERTVKLTFPQHCALADLGERNQTFADGYKPIRKLVELGYAEHHPGRYSGYYSITEAGRAALSRTKENG